LPVLVVDALEVVSSPLTAEEETALEDRIAALQAAMWAYAGLLRQEPTLFQGLAVQAECEAALARLSRQSKTDRRLTEARALCRVAKSILQAALARTESRGAHYRNDFPKRDDESFSKHSIRGRGGSGDAVIFENW
jgi:succinate dehydrogenase/fumarate reductase flavoprotein subunit